MGDLADSAEVLQYFPHRQVRRCIQAEPVPAKVHQDGGQVLEEQPRFRIMAGVYPEPFHVHAVLHVVEEFLDRVPFPVDSQCSLRVFLRIGQDDEHRAETPFPCHRSLFVEDHRTVPFRGYLHREELLELLRERPDLGAGGQPFVAVMELPVETVDPFLREAGAIEDVGVAPPVVFGPQGEQLGDRVIPVVLVMEHFRGNPHAFPVFLFQIPEPPPVAVGHHDESQPLVQQHVEVFLAVKSLVH